MDSNDKELIEELKDEMDIAADELGFDEPLYVEGDIDSGRVDVRLGYQQAGSSLRDWIDSRLPDNTFFTANVTKTKDEPYREVIQRGGVEPGLREVDADSNEYRVSAHRINVKCTEIDGELYEFDVFYVTAVIRSGGVLCARYYGDIPAELSNWL